MVKSIRTAVWDIKGGKIFNVGMKEKGRGRGEDMLPESRLQHEMNVQLIIKFIHARSLETST